MTTFVSHSVVLAVTSQFTERQPGGEVFSGLRGRRATTSH